MSAPASPAHLARGACVISIDTELARGETHRRDGSQGKHHLDTEREVIAAVLEMFARYEIAATWAVVGHLFLDACQNDGRGVPDVAARNQDSDRRGEPLAEHATGVG